MTFTRTTLVAAVVLAAGAGAVLSDDGARDPDAGFVTREWTWVTEAGFTTFTAYGPAEQVNGFDPRDSVVACEGCMLASSIVPAGDDTTILIEAAE